MLFQSSLLLLLLHTAPLLQEAMAFRKHLMGDKAALPASGVKRGRGGATPQKRASPDSGSNSEDEDGPRPPAKRQAQAKQIDDLFES